MVSGHVFRSLQDVDLVGVLVLVVGSPFLDLFTLAAILLR